MYSEAGKALPIVKTVRIKYYLVESIFFIQIMPYSICSIQTLLN